jgi:hypothetical protein
MRGIVGTIGGDALFTTEQRVAARLFSSGQIAAPDLGFHEL